MTLDLLYFAWVRDAFGRDSETVDLPDDVATIRDLLDWLRARGGAALEAADWKRLRFAIDQQFAPVTASLAGAREVAIFPPVTGG